MTTLNPSPEMMAPIREHLRWLLTKGNAHMTFEEAVAAFPGEAINTRVPNGAYTPWHVLEHLRLTQWDILDFICNPTYQERDWPTDYWPPQDRRATLQEWSETIQGFLRDRQALVDIVMDPATDLLAPIPHGSGQTVLREILLVADHNAYHIGEFAILRQIMGTWGATHRGG
jgi:DinB superfamily